MTWNNKVTFVGYCRQSQNRLVQRLELGLGDQTHSRAGRSRDDLWRLPRGDTKAGRHDPARTDGADTITIATPLNLFAIHYVTDAYPARTTAPAGATVVWINSVNTDQPSDSEVGDIVIVAA